jgi:ubiquinone/menaquinone biosynthesis C-methylase UbiE
LARQALSSTREGYDLLAPKFDYTPFRTPASILAAAARQIGPAGSIAAALDVCCGTGAAMESLRPLCRDRIVGVDFSVPMLAVARRNTHSAAGTARLEFVQANVLELPYERAFDVAVCFGALGHILPRDQARFVGQIKRALVPGGRFVFASSYRPSHLSPRYWLSRGFNAAMHVRNALVRPPFVMFYLTFLVPPACKLLEAHGFRVEIRQGVFPAPYEKGCLVIATLPESHRE